MADYGIDRRFKRDKVTLQVLRGFNPTEPGKLSFLAAPLDVVDTAGDAISGRVSIKSGMAIVVENPPNDAYVGGVTGSGFRNAVAADNASQKSIFIALSDAEAHDVQASGKLVGLDCSDKYEVQTGYFDATKTYTQDAAITCDAGGQFTLAVSGDLIVGYISEVGPNANGSIPYVGKTLGAVSGDVIQFKTGQTGVTVA